MFAWLVNPLIETLYWLAHYFPLPVFAFLGAFIEEIIAPIPSPFVMALMGSLAAVKDVTLMYAILLILIGALGKTIGGLIIYVVADKGEEVLVKEFGKFLGISSRDIENIGKRLNKGWKDDVVLFLLYAMPMIPSAPVSIVCGLVKINMRTYLTSAFLGAMTKNAFYFYLGHTGVYALEAINQGAGGWEMFGYVLIAVITVIFVSIYFLRRKSNKSVFLDKNAK